MTETMEATEKKVHHGLNVKRVRKAKGIKQIALGIPLGITTQQGVHDLEKKRVISEEQLKIIAKELDVDINILKNMPEDDSGFKVHFEYNNNFTAPIGNNQDNHFNMEDKNLERLLKAERENERLKIELKMLKAKTRKK